MPNFKESTKTYTVGYMSDTYLKSLADQSPSQPNEIKLPEDWNKHDVVISTTTVTDLDVNDDGYQDAVEGRVVRIGYGTPDSPYQFIAFTSVFLGSADRIFGSDAIFPENPDLLDSASMSTAPASSYWEESARTMIGFDDKSLSDRNVARDVHSILTFCFNSRGYLVFVEQAMHPHNVEARDARVRLDGELPKEFKFAARSLEKVASSESGSHYSNRLNNILNKINASGQLPELKVAYDIWQFKSPDPTEEEKQSELYQFFLAKAKTYYDDPVGEANWLWKKTAFIKKQATDGGLFDQSENGFVAKANNFARTHGYSNYAEMRMRERYNMSSLEYRNMAIGLLEKSKPEMEGWFEEMRSLSDRPVWELNIYDLAEKKKKAALEKIGVKEEPKLTPDEAIGVAKAFYKDLGLDLDNLPNGGRVIFNNVSGGGYYDFYQVEFLEGKTSSLLFTFDPKDGVSLERLSILIHEVGHAVHYNLGSTFAEGSLWGGVFTNSNDIRETMAIGFEGVVFEQVFMDRYLTHVKGFENPEVCKVLASEYIHYREWWSNIMMARGLFEINLYTDRDENGNFIPMSDRLDFWQELMHEGFGCDDIGVPSSLILFYPTHVDYLVADPFILPAYAVGQELSHRMTKDIGSALLSGNSQTVDAVMRKISTIPERADTLHFIDDAENAYDRK